MRKYNFRGQDDSGKWHYGSLITMYDNDGKLCNFIFKGDKSELQNIEPWDDFILVKPESVGEYINLKDKHDNEIFEGDIIDHIKGEYRKSPNDPWQPQVERFVVTFKDCAFRPMDILSLVTDSLQIIGNITDNPEFLK